MLRAFLLIGLFMNLQLFSQVNTAGWKYVGPRSNSYQFKGLFLSVWADETDPNVVLAGSSGGGLFVTKNASSELPSWTNITDELPLMNFGVNGIVVKKNTNHQQIYIATNTGGGLVCKNFGNGILYTANGGRSWEQVGPKGSINFNFPLNGLSVSSDNENEMATYYGKDLYLTQDSWKTFIKVNLPFHKELENTEISDVEFSPNEPGVVFVCTKTYLKNKAQLFLSRDHGNNWKDITPTDVQAERLTIATLKDIKFKGRFYLAYGTNDIWFKYFDGTNFSKPLNTQPVQHLGASAYWCFDLKVNQVDTNIIYFSMTETSLSTNAGASFTKIGFYNGANTHADVRDMCLAKSTPGGKGDRLYLANDGGISVNNNLFGPNSVLFRNLNGEGLYANQFWGIDVLQSDTFFVAGGTQDNGGFFIKKAKEGNNLFGCGDGYYGLTLNDTLALMLGNPPMFMLHNINDGISRYINIPDKNYEARRPMVLKDSFVYIGYHDVWRAKVKDLVRYKFNFENISLIPNKLNNNGSVQNREIKALCINNHNKGLVAYTNPSWHDKNEGKLYYCPDILKKDAAFVDITEITRNKDIEICRWSQVESIVADEQEDNTFYMIYKDVYDQRNSHVYKLIYYPDSHIVSINLMDHNLDKLGFNKLKMDEQTHALYLAANSGVYRLKLNGDTVWKSLDFFPKVLVSDISINDHTNTIYVSTFGRGIWAKQVPVFLDNEKRIERSSVAKKPFKVDGSLVIGSYRKLELKEKMIITKGSKIYLKRKAKLIVDPKKIVDEHNDRVQINDVIIKHKTAKVIYTK